MLIAVCVCVCVMVGVNPNAPPIDVAGIARLDAQVADAEAVRDAIAARERELLAGAGAVGGTLIFVDLAGNEYGAETNHAKGEAAREAREINQSLLALKECIRARAQGAAHVPYRNSQLTRLLRRHLEADGSTVAMIANLSPAARHASKTLSTMQYAKLVAETSDTQKATGNSQQATDKGKKA